MEIADDQVRRDRVVGRGRVQFEVSLRLAQVRLVVIGRDFGGVRLVRTTANR